MSGAQHGEPRLTLKDFPVGKRWTTHGITLTDYHIMVWTGLVGDWHSIHIDAEFAKTHPLGRRVIHAQLLFALGVGLMSQTNAFEGGVQGWLGCDKLRAHGPAFPGDTIHTVVDVAESRASSSRPDRGVVTLKYRVVNQDGKDLMTWDYAIQVKA